MSEIATMRNQVNVISGSFRKNWVVRMLGRLRSWNERRNAVRLLQAMSDELLRDIGISRYEIHDVVNQRGAFAKLPTPSTDQAVVAPLNKAAA